MTTAPSSTAGLRARHTSLAIAIAIASLVFLSCTPIDSGRDDDASEGEGEGEENGDGAVGDTCAFNSDCGAGLRCECSEADGCACAVGERGTGVNGVDTCVDGNDCASSVCVEDNEGTFTCSGECVDDADCEARLPICSDIAFVGRICIREP